ncbi:hypothetical protein [Mangrovibacterium diazotrophicum]|uniref:Uncharacterized protein n=1 Tax=Mangrovibacterium diazotrophicum TaxID=1261403 RepID=A0A419W371_9BACT|nr:hypothetical protein [Mangrovibacterium diazotrophicum]RKD89879.1 hypothetical protein BC643_0213 [Mangrovibacterium diazotrophicum]
MLTTINKAWNWIGVKAKEIMQTNDFGNIIFKSTKKEISQAKMNQELKTRLVDAVDRAIEKNN